MQIRMFLFHRSDVCVCVGSNAECACVRVYRIAIELSTDDVCVRSDDVKTKSSHHMIYFIYYR